MEAGMVLSGLDMPIQRLSEPVVGRDVPGMEPAGFVGALKRTALGTNVSVTGNEVPMADQEFLLRNGGNDEGRKRRTFNIQLPMPKCTCMTWNASWILPTWILGLDSLSFSKRWHFWLMQVVV